MVGRTVRKDRSCRCRLVAAAALFAGVLGVARGQEFPEKPVEITLLFGGSAQIVGQLLGELMSRQLPEPVIAVSRTGGGGAVGYRHVQRARPDGYTIVWNSNSISTAHYQGNIPFSYEALSPVARISLEVPVVAIRGDRSWTTLEDLAALAAESGRKLKIGISGRGSFTHLTAAALFERLGLPDQVTYVPYGQGKAPVEVLAGRIDAAVQLPGPMMAHQESGQLAFLCVTSAEPVAQLPATPVCADTGAPGLDLSMWRGLAAPKDTPADVVAALQAAAKAATESPEFQEAASNLGFEIAYLPAAEFGEVIATDDAVIKALMTDLGLVR